MNTKKTLLLRPKSFLEQANAHPRSCCVPWTLKYIQSIFKKRNFPIYFYDFKVNDHINGETVKLIKNYNPDYIVIQSNSLEYLNCKDILKRIREVTKAKIILVGQYASYADSIVEKIDFLVKGESEEIVADFIMGQKGERLNLEHIHLVEDLDKLPFPHYDKGELRNYYYPYPIKINNKVVWGSVLSSRGCPHNCIFCTQILRESYGKKLRLRSAENIIDEIKYLLELGANVISFEDDDFTFSFKHVNAICDKLISEGIRVKWICQARVDELDFEILKKMKEAGCVLIRFGIESGSARIIEILRKAERGTEWIEKTKDVFRWTRKLGISTDAMFIIGSPSETVEEIFMGIDLAKLLNPDMLQVCFFTPYPGSLAYQIYANKLKNLDEKRLYHYGGLIANLSCVDSERLLCLQKQFYRSVVFRPKFLINHLMKYLPFYIFNYKKVFKVLDIRNFLSFKGNFKTAKPDNLNRRG